MALAVERKVLQSGVTVLCANDRQASDCLLRLVVRVGSLDEVNECDRGVAHFIEHCGFRGTRTYENGALQRMVEAMGSRFGPDLNAKTGLTETIWMLNVPVNGDGPEQRDKVVSALHMMGEWAHSIRFSEDDVEAERKVILEEYRMKRGSSQRVKQIYWDKVMPRVGARMPIGTRESIMGITAAQLRAFYDAMYTPDRMCFVAVGNLTPLEGARGLFDTLETEDVFGRLLRTTQSIPRSVRQPCDLPKDGLIACAIEDSGLSSTSVTIEIFSHVPLQTGDCIEFLHHELKKRVFASVLEARLREVSRAGKWRSGGVSCRLAVSDQPIECTTVSAECHGSPSREQAAEYIYETVQLLLEEIARIQHFPPSVAEVDFAKQKWRQVFKRRLLPTVSRDEICAQTCEELVQHFILNERVPVLDPALEAELSLDLLEPEFKHQAGTLTANDLWEYSKSLFTNLVASENKAEQRPPTSTAVVLQGHQCGGIGETELLSLVKNQVQELQKAKLEPWTFHPPLENFEELRQALLPDDILTNTKPPGQWRHVSMSKTGAVTFCLSNGIKVCVKNTKEIHPHKISMQAFALGGSDRLSHIEDVAFSFLSSCVHGSGLGLLGGSELTKVESLHATSVRLQHHCHHRGLGGSCSSERLELLLQMIVAVLSSSERPLDPTVFARFMRIFADGLQDNSQSNSPEVQVAESVRDLFFGDNEPVLLPLTQEALGQVTLDMIQSLYHEAFLRDPTEFTFVFCGDIGDDVVSLGSLFEAYLGSMLQRGSSTSTRWPCLPRNLELACPSRDMIRVKNFNKSAEGSKDVEKEQQDQDQDQGHGGLGSSGTHAKAHVMLGHHVTGDMWDPMQEVETALQLRVACLVAQNALLEKLRHKEPVYVYTVGVENSRNSLGRFGMVFTSMSCDAAHAQHVANLAFAEYEKLREPIQVEALTTLTTQMTEWHRKSVTNNSHWLFWLLDAWKRCQVAGLTSGELETACAAVDASASQVTDEVGDF